VKQTPSDPTKMSEIIEFFFGDDNFEMLSKETNLYYFQTQGKYDSSSKVLKRVDVSVVCATHKKKRNETRYIYKFCLVLLHKGECFQRYYSGITRSLGKCSLKIIVHKNNYEMLY
jgi:hypothetical protein